MGRYQGKIEATLLAGYVYGDKNAKKAINLIRRGYMAGNMTSSPVFSISLTSLRIPTNPNYHMSIKKSQAILKCFIDLKSSVWFTLGSEDETMFCDT